MATKKARTSKPKPRNLKAVPKATGSFKIEEPHLFVEVFEIEIGGPSLYLDRMHPGVVEGYGETAVDTGKTRALPITKEAVFARAKYLNEDGKDCVPEGALRGAIRDAAVMTDKEIAKASVNRSLIVLGDLLPLKYDKCVMKEDIGRNSGMNRSPRLVIRPRYLNWKLTFRVQLIVNEINPSQLYSLVVLAGACIGIGNWRPGTPKGGPHGRFDVLRFQHVNVAQAAE